MAYSKQVQSFGHLDAELDGALTRGVWALKDRSFSAALLEILNAWPTAPEKQLTHWLSALELAQVAEQESCLMGQSVEPQRLKAWQRERAAFNGLLMTKEAQARMHFLGADSPPASPLSGQLTHAGHTLNISRLNGVVTAFIPTITTGKCTHGANTVEKALEGVLKLGRPNLGFKLCGSDAELCQGFLTEAKHAVNLIEEQPASERIVGLELSAVPTGGMIWTVYGDESTEVARGSTVEAAVAAYQKPRKQVESGFTLGL